MKDRLSIHVDNGQSEIFEAISILRNGGTVSRSGLVGITNKTYLASSDPILPETIFNVQSSGESDIRFSSLGSYKSNLQLLGNGNATASGFQITYNPAFDTASLDSSSTHPTYSFGLNSVVDFSLIRASGTGGVELGFMSVNEKGFVGIGSTYQDSVRLFTVTDALTISHSGDINSSGTIAIREQASPPLSNSKFGKIYVRPRIIGEQTQSLYFLDDGGTEFDLVNSKFDYFDGNLYGDQYGNTYGGWYTPEVRTESSTRTHNTLLGWGAANLASDIDENTIIGYLTGSGLSTGDYNTVLGSRSLTHSNSSNSNVIVGYNNVSRSNLSSDEVETINSTILIGNNLYTDEDPDDYSLAIGFGDNPIVRGSMGSSNRTFSIYSPPSQRTYLSVDSLEHDFRISHSIENSRDVSVLEAKDKIANDTARGMMSLRFSNSSDSYQTLMDFDPSGSISYTHSFTEPTIRRPFASISGDLKLLGAIRFRDGSSLESAGGHIYYSTTGINRTLAGGAYWFSLSFADLNKATTLISPFNPSESYVPVEVKDVSSYKVGKLSVADFSQYISSGMATVGLNCNASFTNADNVIDLTNNERSVFIGCDVATNATGWKHSIFMGTQAGYEATIPNPSLATDTACTFIGYQAGYQTINSQNAIFIGTSAGKNADSSNGSIFIGPSAGENSTNPTSIGIGAHALGGELSEGEGGSKNIEIVAGLDDNQRLMYSSGNLSSRLNIQNSIAGDTSERKISVGDAILDPDAPLSVRRDVNITAHQENDHVQTWYNNNLQVGTVDASGDYIRRDEAQSEAWFGNYEGFMTEYIYAPSSFETPTSGLMRIRTYSAGFGTDRLIYVTNRDVMLDIHGPGAGGPGSAYVVTMRVNGENRPIHVSCSGT